MNSTSFAQECGIVSAKGKAPLTADLYGGDAVPVFGAGSKILATEMNIDSAPTMLGDESKNGTQMATDEDIAMLPVTLNGSVDLRTVGAGKLLFHAFGYEGLDGPLASGTKHAHLFMADPQGKDQIKYSSAEIALDPTITANDYKNRYFNAYIKDGMGNRIAVNSTIKEFTISAEAGQACKMEFSGSAQKQILDKTYAQTTGATLPALIGEMKRFRFSDLKLLGTWIGVWNGAGTSITDERNCLLDFTATYNFGQAEGVQTSCSGLAQDEPVADDMSEFSVELSRYKADTYKWLEAMEAGTKLSFKALFSVGDYKFYLFAPKLSLSSAPIEKGGGGKISLSCKGLYSAKENDPFLNDRTFGAETFDIPFDTSFYCILVDDVATNYMRAV